MDRLVLSDAAWERMVESGGKLVAATGEALSRIARRVSDINGVVGEISNAA